MVLSEERRTYTFAHLYFDLASISFTLRSRTTMAPRAPSTSLASTERPLKRLKHPSNFHTLEREYHFAHPSTSSSAFPEVHRLVAPLLDGFDALFDSGEEGTATAKLGLLSLAVKSLDTVALFDGTSDKNAGLGNKIECESSWTLLALPKVKMSSRPQSSSTTFPSLDQEYLRRPEQSKITVSFLQRCVHRLL